jgi:salicylate hydroxylase
LLENPNFWWGPQRVVVGVPLQAGESYSLELAHPGQTGSAGDWSKKGDKEEMRTMFADFEPVVRMLMDVVSEGNLLVWKLVQLPELEEWVWESGRVVLIGDGMLTSLDLGV